MVKNIMAAQSAQNLAHQPGFVSLIIQVLLDLKSYKSTF